MNNDIYHDLIFKYRCIYISFADRDLTAGSVRDNCIKRNSSVISYKGEDSLHIYDALLPIQAKYQQNKSPKSFILTGKSKMINVKVQTQSSSLFSFSIL